MKESIAANLPSGGIHFDFFAVIVSKASFFVLSDLSSLLWKKWPRSFSTSCPVVNSSVFFRWERR